jgi:nitrogenase molybdenum-cofactor synthesis protein NifE
MSELGMIPQLIQCHGIGENDKQSVSMIMKKANPYITQSANISPMQYIYDVLKPTLYLGHEYAMRLRKKKIAQVHTDMGGAMLGYEITGYFTEQLIIAKKEAEMIQNEDESNMKGMIGMPGNMARGGM